jgi:hypothetical protein
MKNIGGEKKRKAIVSQSVSDEVNSGVAAVEPQRRKRIRLNNK